MNNTNSIFIDINREFVKEITPLCVKIIEIAKLLKNKTIFKGVVSLLKFSEEFEKYNSLIEGGDLEDVNFKEDIESCFNSMNRQLNKHKKINLIWQVEGKVIPISSELFVMKKCYPSWRLLSTILIDNAVKYSTNETDITINLHQTEYRKTIDITNIGPLLNTNEEEAIFTLNENYRGVNARKSGVEGQGLGLKLAKLIILSHQWRGATIYAKCTPIENVKLGGLPLGKFTVSFSIKNEGDATSNNGVMTNIPNKLNEFLSHEFIRINPLLSKQVVEVLDDSCNNKEENSQTLKEKIYCLYSAIMTHIKKCELIWNNASTYIRVSEEMRDGAKRFDNQLRDTMNRYLWFTDNSKVVVCKEGKSSFRPMHISLHLFFFIFTQCLFLSKFEGTISIIANQQEIQILPPEGDFFDDFPDNEKKILDVILQENNLQMRYNKIGIKIVKQ